MVDSQDHFGTRIDYGSGRDRILTPAAGEGHHKVRVRAGCGSNGLLAYRVYEPERVEETVLLLHGLGSAALDWTMQTAVLARRYRVVALDFPGHGESQPVPRGVNIRDLSGSVFRTVDHLNLSPGIIVGHSLGGLTALQMVIDAPGRFQAMVLVNAVPHVSFSRHAIRQGIGRVPDVLLNRMDSLAEFVASEHFSGPELDLLRRLAVHRIQEADRTTYLRLITAIALFDVRSQLEQISIPVLIVSGSEDRVFSHQDKHVLLERIPGAVWVKMNGSGHASPQDSPQQFNEILCAFLHRLEVKGKSTHSESSQAGEAAAP